MEKEKYIIIMEILNMMENLLMINLKDLENILAKMVNIISENGEIINLMEKENIYLIREIYLKMLYYSRVNI